MYLRESQDLLRKSRYLIRKIIEDYTAHHRGPVDFDRVKKILSELIESEEKHTPLSDEILTDMLQQKGYNIARRTVAKYREQLHIPVARLRKEL